MNKLIRILIFCIVDLIFVANIFAVKFPMLIPSDEFGNGQESFGEGNTYKMQLIFELTNSKMVFNDGGYLILPVPASNNYQKVTIQSVDGVTIKEVLRDIYGNVVLMSTEIEPHSLPQNVKVLLTIDTIRTKINKNMNPDLTVDIRQDFAKNKLISKDDVFKLANDYREFVNKKAVKPKNRIYNDKVFDLFPIEDKIYYDAMSGFLSSLADNGISSNIFYGWNVPEKTDYVSRDFVAEIVTSDGGVILLNKQLKQYNSDGTHIWWNAMSQKYATEYDENFLYIAVTTKSIGEDNKIRISNKANFIDGKVYISVGKIKGVHLPDERFAKGYDRVLVTPKTKTPIKLLAFGTRYDKSPSDFVMFKGKNSPKKQAQANASIGTSAKQTQNSSGGAVNLTKCTFCKNVKDGTAIGVTTNFVQTDTVYVLLNFKQTKSAKTLTYKWINPNGNVHYQKTSSVAGNWSSYFTYINTNSKLQRGVWKLEITINGVLEKTASFTVQ